MEPEISKADGGSPITQNELFTEEYQEDPTTTYCIEIGTVYIDEKAKNVLMLEKFEKI